MPIKILLSISTLMILTSWQPVLSQNLVDSAFVVRVSENMKSKYSKLFIREAPIFNGRTYSPFLKHIENGHSFFIDDKFAFGNITYDGFLYTNIQIAYDLVQNNLLLLHFDSLNAVIVPPDHVGSFYIQNHRFVNIKADSGNMGIKPGYYDLLYEGKVGLLVKREKTVSERVTSRQVEILVTQQDRYYLKKGSSFTSIKDKRALLNLLRSTHDENQRFIKSNQLNFKRAKESSFLKLVQFHDSLISK